MASRDRRRVALGAAAFAAGAMVYLVRFRAGLGLRARHARRVAVRRGRVFLAWRRPALRLPAAIACVALPVAWYAQYQGGADPQWGGRYILLSGALLTVAGVVALRTAPRAFVAVLVLAAVTTAMGVGWLSVRSNTTADGMAAIVARNDQVLISRQTHMLREGGAFYTADRHWLTAPRPRSLREAVRIASESGATEIGLVGGEDQAPPASLGDFSRGRDRTGVVRAPRRPPADHDVSAGPVDRGSASARGGHDRPGTRTRRQGARNTGADAHFARSGPGSSRSRSPSRWCSPSRTPPNDGFDHAALRLAPRPRPGSGLQPG